MVQLTTNRSMQPNTIYSVYRSTFRKLKDFRTLHDIQIQSLCHCAILAIQFGQYSLSVIDEPFYIHKILKIYTSAELCSMKHVEISDTFFMSYSNQNTSIYLSMIFEKTYCENNKYFGIQIIIIMLRSSFPLFQSMSLFIM